jgi:hypothetical protein
LSAVNSDPASAAASDPSAAASEASAAGPASVAAPAGSEPADAAVVRYRCAGCGNLTRFDVVTQRRTREFHHFSVGGELTVEDVEVLQESVEEVSCRWCGHGDAVEVLGDEAPASSPTGY